MRLDFKNDKTDINLICVLQPNIKLPKRIIETWVVLFYSHNDITIIPIEFGTAVLYDLSYSMYFFYLLTL